MQTLVLALMLALSTPVEKREVARLVVSDGQARTSVIAEAANADPCALARRIVHQRPCLEPGDCRSLELWKRSFGAPRLEPADPNRGFVVHRGPPGSARRPAP